jgi:hypothetical protein
VIFVRPQQKKKKATYLSTATKVHQSVHHLASYVKCKRRLVIAVWMFYLDIAEHDSNPRKHEDIGKQDVGNEWKGVINTVLVRRKPAEHFQTHVMNHATEL